jgi:hypothetical protein
MRELRRQRLRFSSDLSGALIGAEARFIAEKALAEANGPGARCAEVEGRPRFLEPLRLMFHGSTAVTGALHGVP